MFESQNSVHNWPCLLLNLLYCKNFVVSVPQSIQVEGAKASSNYSLQIVSNKIIIVLLILWVISLEGILKVQSSEYINVLQCRHFGIHTCPCCPLKTLIC